MKKKRIGDLFLSFRLIVLSVSLLSLVNSSSLLYTHRTLELLRLSSQLTSSVKQTIIYIYTHKEERIYENEKDKEVVRERDGVYARAKREIRAIASAHTTT